MDYVKAVVDLIDWGVIEGPVRVWSERVYSKHNDIAKQFKDVSSHYAIDLWDDLNAADARALSDQNTLTYVGNEYHRIMNEIRKAIKDGEKKIILGVYAPIEDLHYLTIAKLMDRGYTVWYTEDKHWVVEW